VKDATEVVVVQQPGLSSQKVPGETERRQARFRKRVLTFRPSLAVPLILAYRSVVVEVFCQQVSHYMQSGECVSVHTVKAVASLGVQRHSLFPSALGACDQPASRPGYFTRGETAPDTGSRAGLDDLRKRNVCCPCRKVNPLSSGP
jgi:hypothetical protein